MKKIEPMTVHVRLYGHNVEVTLLEASHPETRELVNEYCMDACSMSHVVDQLAEDNERGDFESSTRIVLNDTDPETLVTLRGTWRIVPDFTLWKRVFRWSYCRGLSESLTEAMFTKAYGLHKGAHSFSKWKGYRCNIEKMVGYLSGSIRELEQFMGMVMEKVQEYESRLEKAKENKRG